MLDRFDHPTLEALGLARQAALANQDDAIRIEHLLQGLLEQGRGRFVKLLGERGVDAAAVQRARGAEPVTGRRQGLLPFDGEAKQAIKAAIHEAELLEHPLATADHLALALLAAPQGPATQLFAKLNLEREQLLDDLRQALHLNPPSGAYARPSPLPAGSTFLHRFTDHARKVFGLARQHAQAVGAPEICSVELLLALVEVEDGLAASALLHLGVDSASLEPAMEALVAHDRVEWSVRDEIPFSEEAKRVVARAAEEADALGQRFVDTEHLLLALIRGGRGAGLLTASGVDLEAIRRGTLELTQGTAS